MAERAKTARAREYRTAMVTDVWIPFNELQTADFSSIVKEEMHSSKPMAAEMKKREIVVFCGEGKFVRGIGVLCGYRYRMRIFG